MKNQRYLTTGEAAELLGISRSTVSRRFDSGKLRGKVNPYSGERLISLHSVESFIRDHNLPIDSSCLTRYRIIAVGAGRRLRENLGTFVEEDGRMDLVCMDRGVHALVECAKENPDLLLLSTSLCDTHPSHIIDALKGMPDAASLRIVLCGSEERGDEAISSDVHARMGPDEMNNPGKLKAFLYDQLSLPPQASEPQNQQEHVRRWPRVPVDLPCDIRIVSDSNAGGDNAGAGRVKNISAGGMLVSGLTVEGGSIPAESFRMMVRINAAPLKDWEALCMPVRLCSNGTLSAGLQYDRISQENRRRVTHLAAV